MSDEQKDPKDSKGGKEGPGTTPPPKNKPKEKAPEQEEEAPAGPPKAVVPPTRDKQPYNTGHVDAAKGVLKSLFPKASDKELHDAVIALAKNEGNKTGVLNKALALVIR